MLLANGGDDRGGDFFLAVAADHDHLHREFRHNGGGQPAKIFLRPFLQRRAGSRGEDDVVLAVEWRRRLTGQREFVQGAEPRNAETIDDCGGQQHQPFDIVHVVFADPLDRRQRQVQGARMFRIRGEAGAETRVDPAQQRPAIRVVPKIHRQIEGAPYGVANPVITRPRRRALVFRIFGEKPESR